MLSCVRHCSQNKPIFYLGPQPLPADGVCPVCSRKFTTRVDETCEANGQCPIIVAPFVLPCPLIRLPHPTGKETARHRRPTKGTSAHAVPPLALLLRPNSGSFLGSYKDGDILHIGIVNSQGDRVYHFDEDGIHVDQFSEPVESSSWYQAICIRLREDACFYSLASTPGPLWDTAVDEEASSSNWVADRFHAAVNNCYDFVLACLARIAVESGVSLHELCLPDTGKLSGSALENCVDINNDAASLSQCDCMSPVPNFCKCLFSQHCLLAVAKRAGRYFDLYHKVTSSPDGYAVVENVL